MSWPEMVLLMVKVAITRKRSDCLENARADQAVRQYRDLRLTQEK
jgi:hypothetical protein